jgi:hypothetical protein
MAPLSRSDRSNDLNQFTWTRPLQPIARRAIEWRAASDERLSRETMVEAEYRMTPADLRHLVVRRELKEEVYEPLEEEPSLFRTFSDIEPTEDGFLAFVLKFGFLTRPMRLRHMRRYDRVDFFGNLVYAHRKIKAAILEFDSVGAQPPLSDAASRLRAIVNENLGGGQFDSAGGVVARIVYRLDLVRRTEKQELRLVPDSLLSAMWLQLAQEMTGNHRFKRCRGCNTWFKVGDVTDLHARRSDAVLCHDASCKMRAIRNRKKEEAAKRAARVIKRTARRAR